MSDLLILWAGCYVLARASLHTVRYARFRMWLHRGSH